MASSRFKLLGTYRSPKFKYGQRVNDERRGTVRIVGLSAGRIPWPIGIGPGGRSLVLYWDLARAVKRESGVAICFWFGIGHCTVRKWRKALGVPAKNEGTLARAVAHGRSRKGRRAIAAMHNKSRNPTLDAPRRAKISAAKIGKPRPASVVAAIRRAHIGHRQSAESRRKMSESHRRRGTRPPWLNAPWAAWEDEAVRTLRPVAAAATTGRTLFAVFSRRHKLGLNEGRSRG
jgi:hypothetical protein